MTATITLENANTSIINALKTVIKLNPEVKFKIKKSKEPSDELLEAIRQVENGEVTKCKDFDDFKQKVLSWNTRLNFPHNLKNLSKN